MLLSYFAASKMERAILRTVCLEFLRRFCEDSGDAGENFHHSGDTAAVVGADAGQRHYRPRSV